MPHLVAQQTRTAPIVRAHGAGAEKSYPGLVVVLSILAFCLSFWAVVIFAVAHYG
jgi:hypothetical protein